MSIYASIKNGLSLYMYVICKMLGIVYCEYENPTLCSHVVGLFRYVSILSSFCRFRPAVCGEDVQTDIYMVLSLGLLPVYSQTSEKQKVTPIVGKLRRYPINHVTEIISGFTIIILGARIPVLC